MLSQQCTAHEVVVASDTAVEPFPNRLSSRLARYLLKQAASGPRINITHQALATELGSAREVISRQLKELEKTGMVTLQRGCILLQDMDALKKLAGV